ncbi:unnamed protein product [Rotaria sp. Silwood1]|nr:unnamed protein product [Rotaria sp. Silwood1]CAF1667554.1 unnamed protein product [Rotaria sp. Silwood1]CAF3907808.1 unnamed protein product [Rotaria sp. Silwood1]CAF4009170.1 unnamed protein product [Rotaria sp. Silwood1]CAF4961305.1 unnamed protein product [Rotaria sp. Silwood1]
MSNTSTRIKVGLISNIRTKLAANLDIDGTAISSGDWSGEITGKISEVDDEEDGNVDVVASTKGQSVPLAWAQNSKLSIDHIEYIVALQMSMVEKILVKNDEQRSYELVTYLTDLQLEPIHKMMTLKSELNQTVK